MTKEYRAKTGVGFSVVANGKKMRISFDMMLNGQSIYVTSDEAVIEAIEAHRWFKNKFVLSKVSGGVAKPKEESETDAKPGLEDMAFGSAIEARDYLAEKYGASLNATKTKERIKAYGATKGLNIVFE